MGRCSCFFIACSSFIHRQNHRKDGKLRIDSRLLQLAYANIVYLSVFLFKRAKGNLRNRCLFYFSKKITAPCSDAVIRSDLFFCPSTSIANAHQYPQPVFHRKSSSFFTSVYDLFVFRWEVRHSRVAGRSSILRESSFQKHDDFTVPFVERGRRRRCRRFRTHGGGRGRGQGVW